MFHLLLIFKLKKKLLILIYIFKKLKLGVDLLTSVHIFQGDKLYKSTVLCFRSLLSTALASVILLFKSFIFFLPAEIMQFHNISKFYPHFMRYNYLLWLRHHCFLLLFLKTIRIACLIFTFHVFLRISTFILNFQFTLILRYSS